MDKKEKGEVQVSFDGNVINEADVEYGEFIDEGPQVEGGSV